MNTEIKAVEKHLAVQAVKLDNIEKNVDEIKVLLKEQNGRISKNENDLIAFKSSASIIALIVSLIASSGLLLAWVR